MCDQNRLQKVAFPTHWDAVEVDPFVFERTGHEVRQNVVEKVGPDMFIRLLNTLVAKLTYLFSDSSTQAPSHPTVSQLPRLAPPLEDFSQRQVGFFSLCP